MAAWHDAGVLAGCHSNADAAGMRLEQGFRMVTASCDLVALQSGLRAHLAAAKSAIDNN